MCFCRTAFFAVTIAPLPVCVLPGGWATSDVEIFPFLAALPPSLHHHLSRRRMILDVVAPLLLLALLGGCEAAIFFFLDFDRLVHDFELLCQLLECLLDVQNDLDGLLGFARLGQDPLRK